MIENAYETELKTKLLLIYFNIFATSNAGTHAMQALYQTCLPDIKLRVLDNLGMSNMNEHLFEHYNYSSI